MNPKLRKALLASAIASLLSAPVMVTGQTTDAPRQGPGPQVGETAVVPGTAAPAHPLFDHTPEDLEGREIVGPDGDKVGTIADVVMDPERQSVHAVVSSGGMLGIGARRYAVHFDEIRMEGEELRLTTSWDAVRARGRFEEDRYIQFADRDRPIRETALLWPGEVDPSFQPGDIDPAGRPGATDPAGRPGEMDPAGRPGAADPAGRPGAMDPTGRPGDAGPIGEPGATDPNGRPGATAPWDRPGTTGPTSPEGGATDR
jgi:sporulation protein YlmC with PRC-barrel domain